MNFKRVYKVVLGVIIISLLGYAIINVFSKKNTNDMKVSADSKTTVSKKVETKKKAPQRSDDKDMIQLDKFTYDQSSEKKDYPDLTKHPNAWIDVDIASQRVYIKDGDKNLYEMYSSTGKDDTTPRGTYYVENERGDYFYTAPLKLGAYYYVSFLNHGEYLFHTTPTDENGKYVESIAKTLGHEPSSHGCVHLSTPDCKWIYNNVPSGMKVVIHGQYQA